MIAGEGYLQKQFGDGPCPSLVTSYIQFYRPTVLLPLRLLSSLPTHVLNAFSLAVPDHSYCRMIWCPVITHPRLPLSKHALQWYYTGTASLSILPIGLTSRSAPCTIQCCAYSLLAGYSLACRTLLVRAPADPTSTLPFRLSFPFLLTQLYLYRNKIAIVFLY